MITGEALTLPPAAAAEAKLYLRIERADEDALVARLMCAAAELCESFTGQALIARGFSQVLAARPAWQRLARTPVAAITGVEALLASGEPAALGAEAYAIDIDSNGDGWVRVTTPGEARIRVAYRAGMAESWEAAPAAIRQGVIRLAAHLYMQRGGEAGRGPAGPPAAVTALWRPFRRLRLG
jgi:uncharacterized phiE125 gp8 family phage protein